MIEQIKWQVFKHWDDTTRHKHIDEIGKQVLMETAVFQQTSDMLCYHNQLPDLIHLLQTAWLVLKTSGEGSE